MDFFTSLLPQSELHPVEYIVILSYLMLMIIVGVLFKSFSGNISDYFRGGCRGTWWLVGMSAFMSSFSAWTFTGAAGVAFNAGWSVMIIFFANAAGFGVNFLFFGPWFRQLRSITAPQVIGDRYNSATRQFYGFVSIVIGLLASSLHLYGLAIFSVAVFGLPLNLVIIGIGLVVLFYSTSGGNWAVMGTDFLQSMVLLPMTIVVAYFALSELGGISGFFSEIRLQGLEEDYSIVNKQGEFAAGAFTWGWICGMFVKNIISYNTITAAPRYFSVKDGKAARKAALVGLILTLLGCTIWFIPPMAARLLFEEQVLATGLNNPHETAFAIACLNLLPTGLVGLVVVAMFTATMSSMDTGINRNAAIIVRDIIPALFSKLGLPVISGDASQLRLSRIISLILGVVIVCLALWFSQMEGVGIFDIMLAIGSFLAVPMSIPMFFGLFFRKVPSWGGLAAVLSGFATALFIAWHREVFDSTWSFQRTLFSTGGVSTFVFFASGLFWKHSSSGYKSKVSLFFQKMHTPVDFESEVGGSNDNRQLILLGTLVLLIGLFVAPLAFFSENWHMMSGTLFISVFLLLTGGLMLFLGIRSVRGKLKLEKMNVIETASSQNKRDPY